MADSLENLTQEDRNSAVPSFVGSAKSSRSSKSIKEAASAGKAKLETTKPHVVTITVTVAVAYPKPTDDHSKLLEELVKRNKRTVEAPRANQYLHCEYVVAPEHERTITDVVTYSVAAKVFTDTDSRVVKTWDDGQNVWVAWMHSHEIEVTSKNVMSLYDHVVDMKIWDGKDKVSTKARTDRPKAFRLPSGNESHMPGKGVQGVVARQSNSWLNVQPRDSVVNVNKHEVKRPQSISTDAAEPSVDEGREQKETQPPTRVRSTLGRLAGINASDEEHKRINELKRQQATLQKELEKNGSMLRNIEKRMLKDSKTGLADTDKTPLPSTGIKKGSPDLAAKSSSAHTKPVNIPVKLESLFAGVKTVSTKLTHPSGSVRDCYVTLSLDVPLLPKELEKSLNPLVINLKAVKDMPATPVSYNQLSSLCEPVHCKYNFLGHPSHITAGRAHGKHVYFEDVHVVLLGQLDEGEVREFIQGNKFIVQLHDRVQKTQDDTGQASLFGEERDDLKLANVGIVSSKRTAFNAFRSRNEGYDPYGVAHIPLVDILRGQTTICLQVNVNPCPIPDLLRDNPDLDGNRRLVGIPGEVDRPERPPLLPGHYIHAGTTVKMHLSLSVPFVSPEHVPCLLPMPNQVCPFSRVVYYFSYSNKALLKQIEEYVSTANAKALKLDHFEKDVLDAALSTYKLSIEQKKSRTLDVITGFHVIDGNLHWLVLEGIKDGAMVGLHQHAQRNQPKDDKVLVHLFDSSMTFSKRLYAGLDVDLCRVRLHQPITEILKQPLLYVRDMVPKKCLDCITKMHQISSLTKLRDVVHSNSFPTSEMVISMSREFGVPLTYDDFEEQHKENVETAKLADPQMEPAEVEIGGKYNGRRWTPIDNKNREYLEHLRQRDINYVPADHVSMNIVAVQEAGKRRRPSLPTAGHICTDVPPHNYSTQTLNSTHLAKDKMREMLTQQNPTTRYTYHPTYNSAMLVPVNVDAWYKEQDEMAKQRWKTEEGFVYPGMKSSRACNVHPLKPDDSRIEELKLKFRNNILHRNIMEPTLERDRMSWDHRKEDVELYRQPVSYFGSSPPVTIHLAGQRLKEEKLDHKRAEYEDWRSRVVVNEDRMNFHRVLPATEQTNKSNQLDRLTNLLKDEPIKLSLKQNPAPEIPPLSVVQNPSVDTASRARGVKLPPAFDEKWEKHVGFTVGPYDDSSWNMERNKISIKDPNHKYFAKKHGHDINLYHKERDMLSKHVPIQELTAEEKNNHLFRIPPLPQIPAEPDKVQNSKDSADSTEIENELKSSEYRIKFLPYSTLPRVREIYPRHTFHGLAPLTDDRKPVTRDASIGLVVPMETEFETFSNRPIQGVMHSTDASVEIAPSSVLAG